MNAAAWPQYALIGLMASNALCAVASGKYPFVTTLLGTVIFWWLLYMGGFWSAL